VRILEWYLVGKQGIAPDFERVKSVVELKIPQSIKQLQSFLGMLNFLRIFIPNMFELIEPLKGLLRKDVLWSWGIDYDSAFNKLKNVLTELTTFSNYKAKDNFTIQCDALEKALGLLQNNRSVPILCFKVYEWHRINVCLSGKRDVRYSVL